MGDGLDSVDGGSALILWKSNSAGTIRLAKPDPDERAVCPPFGGLCIKGKAHVSPIGEVIKIAPYVLGFPFGCANGKSEIIG